MLGSGQRDVLLTVLGGIPLVAVQMRAGHIGGSMAGCRSARLWVVLSLVCVAGSARAQGPGDASDRAAEATSKNNEKKAQTAGTKPGEAVKAEVVATEEGEEGVKTYKFGAVEVEGRLRSPQILYFLRRVRAEFAAGELGHRSFLLELSDTRRHAAFR
jgi:hypothetical protein